MQLKFLQKMCLGGLLMLGSLNGFGQATTITHDFNDNVVPAPWRAGQGFFISASDQRLKVKVGKQQWEEFSYDLPLNLSAAPKVSFKVRSDNYVQLVLAFITTEAGTEKNNRFYDELIVPVFPSKDMIDVSFDFTTFMRTRAAVPSPMDASKVTSIRFMVDPAVEKNANLEIDDFKVGSAAMVFPRLIAPMTQYAYIGQGATKVMLRGLQAGSTVTATSSDPSKVPNPSVGAIGANGIADLTYTPVANQSGPVKITVKVSRAGMSDLLVPFDLIVEPNIAPTINAVASQTAGSNQTVSLPLSGITDGNTARQQTITITATSSDQTVIRNADITTVYTNPQTYGQLTFKTLAVASGSKNVNITLTLSDDGTGGTNTKTVNIPVTVYSSYYKSPQLSSITNNNFAYIGTEYTTTITGINDGNGGTNIASITATSSNTAAVATPVVSYTPGSNVATISYKALNREMSTITVSLTNSGAPQNSNGNSTSSTTFTVKGIDPPYTGYIEDFQSYGVDGKPTTPNILGGDYYSSGTGGDDRKVWMTNLQGYDQKWFIEGQGAEQRFTLDPAGQKATIAINKPGSVPRTFAGIWYSPRKLFDLSNAKYLSMKVSSSVPNTPVTFDIFDVNDKRYANLDANAKRVGTVPTVFTFAFQGAPADADLDFSKIAAILINVSNLTPFNGTITISELKIGDKAVGAPPSKPAEIMMSPLANRTIFSNTAGYTVNLDEVFVVKDAIKNTTPITLSVTSSNTGLIPTPEISNPSNGHASIKMRPVAGATGIATITVIGKAAGVADKNFTFTVEVLNKATVTPSTITINPNQTYQTISGLGLELGPAREAEVRVADLGASMLRFDIGAEYQPGLEGIENDNSDPFVLDLSKFKLSQVTIDAVKKARDLGCERFIAAVWTPPIWMKGVFAFRPQQDLGGRNKLLPEFYDEFAENIVGSCLAFRNEFGIDLYSICLQNEAEFESSGNLTATCKYTKEEAAAVVKLVYPRLREAGLTTRIHGFDQLPAQNNVLNWFSYFNQVAPTEFDAFSIHAYGTNAVDPANLDNTNLRNFYAEAQRVNPKKELWMTETSGWSQDAEGGKTAISSIFTALANNLSVWTFLSIDRERDVMNFYVHKNFAKFIRPGAVRVGAASSDVPGLAFKHTANNTFTVVLANTGATPKQTKLEGVPTGFQKMYAYLTAPNINTQLVDSVTSADGYMVNLPPNSILTLHSKFEQVVLDTDEGDVANMQLVVYPNPTRGEVSLMLPNNRFNEVKVYDITGRLVMTQPIKANGTALETLNLTGLQKGIYIVSVKGDVNLRTKVMVE